MDLADEVNEALPGLGAALLWPVRELELADGAALAVPGVRHLNREDYERKKVLGKPCRPLIVMSREDYERKSVRRALPPSPPRPIFNKAAAISISKRVPGPQ